MGTGVLSVKFLCRNRYEITLYKRSPAGGRGGEVPENREGRLANGGGLKEKSNHYAEPLGYLREAKKNGVPDRSRTHNLLIRSQVLYPIELRVRSLRQSKEILT